MRDADAAGQQLVFCNAYHLLLQPGPEIIEGTLLHIKMSLLKLNTTESNILLLVNVSSITNQLGIICLTFIHFDYFHEFRSWWITQIYE